MAFHRILNLPELLKKKSFFLFGPRATGKTYLIRHQLKNATVINLLESDYFLRLSARPGEVVDLITAQPHRTVVIDEVQRVPELLNEVHRLIEEKGYRFLLTGSNARSLKRGQSNLLAGRAWQASLFPLTRAEIPQFDLERYLRYGGLPAIYASAHPEEELNAYVHTYLREEIQGESGVRKIPAFSRFLRTAALSNGQILHFSEIASDAAVPASTVREHFQILEDTLIGFNVSGWKEGKKRKALQTSKFYFFDTGVTHAIAGTRALDRNSDLYGRSFEHFIALELRAYLSYRRILNAELCYWRTTHAEEVDFVVGTELALEVKAAARVNSRHLKGLSLLAEEAPFKHRILVSLDRMETRQNGVQCLHWTTFLDRLWAGEWL
jgi:predicted AAA+ superfamily ATPase